MSFHHIFCVWNSFFHPLYLLVMLAFVVPVHPSRFSILRNLSNCVFFFVSLFRSWRVLFISLNCFSFLLTFFKVFIHFSQFCVFFWVFLRDLFNYVLFKELYDFHKVGLKVFFLCFCCVGILRVHCSRKAYFWWWHIALAVGDCVLMLASRY